MLSDPVPAPLEDIGARWTVGLLLDREGVFDRLDPSPFVAAVGRSAHGRTIDQAVLVRFAIPRVARAAPFGDLDEAERLKLAHCGGHAVLADTVVDELGVSDGQMTVVIATVAHQFDFKASKHAVRGEGLCPASPRRRRSS